VKNNLCITTTPVVRKVITSKKKIEEKEREGNLFVNIVRIFKIQAACSSGFFIYKRHLLEARVSKFKRAYMTI